MDYRLFSLIGSLPGMHPGHMSLVSGRTHLCSICLHLRPTSNAELLSNPQTNAISGLRREINCARVTAVFMI